MTDTSDIELILPPSVDDMKFPLDDKSAMFLEGFAAGVATFMKTQNQYIGDHRKSYDPLTVKENKTQFSSYFFDLKYGTRGHEISDYSSFHDLLMTIVKDGLKILKDFNEPAEEE